MVWGIVPVALGVGDGEVDGVEEGAGESLGAGDEGGGGGEGDGDSFGAGATGVGTSAGVGTAGVVSAAAGEVAGGVIEGVTVELAQAAKREATRRSAASVTRETLP